MSLIVELKRRNVFKVGAAYLALAWVMIQLTGTAAPAFGMPEWTLKLVMWIGMLGFPFVLMFAWIYELTPEGLKRESEIDRSQSITHVTSRKLDFIIIGLLVAAIAITVLDRLAPRSGDAVGAGLARDPTSAEKDRAQGALPQQASTLVPAAAPDDKSIAVLPFVNMSSDKEQEYFSDGIAEELLNLLAKIPELRVIARTSSFAFKGEKLEIPEIARRLGVAHVLEGSVRKSGNKVRITAQLVRASDSTHLWSETYDRSLDDIFAVQDEIAGAVVQQLKLTLLGAAPKTRDTNPKTYELALQARYAQLPGGTDATQRAIVLYKQALELEPGYPRALVGLAFAYGSLAYIGQLPLGETIILERDYISQALASDPDFAPAHAALAGIAMEIDNDLPSAARHLARALELDPADPPILGRSALLLARLGRMQNGLAVARYVLQRDPVDTPAHSRVGNLSVLARDWDTAVVSMRRALELTPGLAQANYQIGLALLGKGDAEGALAAFEAERADEEYRVKGRAFALFSLGRHAEYEQALAELTERWGKTWPSEVAQVHAWAGDKDQAFAWLDKAVVQREDGLTHQFLLWLYDSLHEDPRWQSFREHSGTSEAQLAAIPFEVKLPQ